jgi:hypothetical protein
MLEVDSFLIIGSKHKSVKRNQADYCIAVAAGGMIGGNKAPLLSYRSH